MEPWLSKALEMVPELGPNLDYIEDIGTPMYLWIELHMLFERAYEEPRNDDLIRRIYEYAGWCFEQDPQPRAAQDLPTCVVVGLYEHIPQLPAARADMPHWFTRQEVLGMRQVFSYHIGESEYERLIREWPSEVSGRKARRRAGKRGRQGWPEG